MSTETERQIQALLAEHIGAWSAQTRDDLTAKLAAREAAARREALLEVESRLQPPPPWPASDKKVANDRGYAAGWCDALAVVEELRTEESA